MYKKVWSHSIGREVMIDNHQNIVAVPKYNQEVIPVSNGGGDLVVQVFGFANKLLEVIPCSSMTEATEIGKTKLKELDEARYCKIYKGSMFVDMIHKES